MKLSRIEWAVIALTFLGALIRFWNIGFQWMNYDEEFTITFAQPAFSCLQIISASLTSDYTPPLSYLAAHFSMIVFGMNATAIRIPSAIFGTLFVPIMYFVGKEYKDELFGLLCAGFSAIYYNAVFYSKYGRSYAMDFVFFSVAFYFFMRILKGDNKAGIWFALFALCSVWTHLYSAIPLGLMILYLLYERKAYTTFGIFTVGCLPLLSYVNSISRYRCTNDLTCQFGGTHAFGATWQEIIYLTPLDIFAYSAFIIVPIVVWSLWTHRSEKIIQVISLISLATWGSMIALSGITPIILHYAIFLVPMLIIPLILPFYEAIAKDTVTFCHLLVIMIVMILEAVQIAAIAVVQRAWHF